MLVMDMCLAPMPIWGACIARGVWRDVEIRRLRRG
jgi:hypothetical protein